MPAPACSGRLLAFQLTRAGHWVEVFDPAPDAHARGAAGWTAAGMLSPVAELECADRARVRAGPAFAGAVAQAAFAAGTRRCNSARTAACCWRIAATKARRGAWWNCSSAKRRRATRPQALAAAALRELEPAVQGPAHAWLLPCEGRIHTVQAMDALAAAQGVKWHWAQRVERVAPGIFHVRGRARAFDWVFDVRGTGARPELPVRGVRGEIFWLHAPGVRLRRPLRLLHPRHRVYLVPREGDIVVVGASEIESEDRSPVSLRSTVELLAAAHSVVPELAEARVVHSEANLRPALPDNLPHVETQAGPDAHQRPVPPRLADRAGAGGGRAARPWRHAGLTGSLARNGEPAMTPGDR